MARYIDAERLKCDYAWFGNSKSEQYRHLKATFDRYVDGQQTADVRENVHAHWEEYLKEGLRWKCSNCGSRFETPYRFCPNCGAVMDEREKMGREMEKKMTRYIDADKLKERLLVGSELDPEPCKGFRSALLAMVDTQEAADVVDKERYAKLLANAIIVSNALKEYKAADFIKVVRCKDCVHHIDAPKTTDVWCERIDGLLQRNWFCADGERGDEEEHETTEEDWYKDEWRDEWDERSDDGD